MFDMFDGLEINLIRPITGSPNGLSVFFVCLFVCFVLFLFVFFFNPGSSKIIVLTYRTSCTFLGISSPSYP